MLKIFLFVAGVVCLFAAGFGVAVVRPPIQFGWLGLAFIAAGIYLPL